MGTIWLLDIYPNTEKGNSNNLFTTIITQVGPTIAPQSNPPGVPRGTPMNPLGTPKKPPETDQQKPSMARPLRRKPQR